MSVRTAFVNARIFPVDQPPIERGTLIIEDGKIVEVGADVVTDGNVNGDTAMEIVDCEGLSITPGFIDPHTHTGIWEEGAGPGSGNNDGNEMSSAISPYTRALDAIHPEDPGFEDARRGGVTVLGITHGSGNAIGGQLCVVKSVGTIADKMVIREPAGIKMALGENPKRAGTNMKRPPYTRMGVAYLIREAFYNAIEYKKSWERAEADENIREPKRDLGMEILVKVLEKEIPIRCHAHRADDIMTAIRLQEEFGYDLVIDHTTEGIKVADALVEKGIPTLVGPLFAGRSKREVYNLSMATPGVLHSKGGFVALMTDSPFNPIHGLRDNLIWSIREGLPEEDSLKLITLNPAKILGVDDRIGSLTPGKDADFLIFNGLDPLDSRKKVIKTYIDGKLVYDCS